MLAAVVVVGVDRPRTSSRPRRTPSHGKKTVTLVWWHNANQGAGLQLWNNVAKEFHTAHPNVTVKVVPFQNERPAADEDPDRAAVEQPARRLPGVGRRRARRRGEGRQGREHHEVRHAVDQDHRRLGRRLAGERQAVRRSRTTSASSGSGTTRRSSQQAGISTPPSDLAAVPGRRRQAEGRRTSRRSRSEARTAGRTRSTGTTSPSKLCSKTAMQQSAVSYNFTNPCWLKAGNVRAAAPRREAVPGRDSSQRRHSRARRAPPAWSPTARPRWSCRATGIPA